MEEIDATLAALADPARRRVLDLLREGPQRAGELAAAAELSAPAMSRHLRVLRQCGLIEEQRIEDDARVRLFRLRPERFEALADWVSDMQRFWDDPLDAFHDHVERNARVRKRLDLQMTSVAGIQITTRWAIMARG